MPVGRGENIDVSVKAAVGLCEGSGGLARDRLTRLVNISARTISG